MREVNTQDKVLERKSSYRLLVDEKALDFKLSRNLSLLAGDILSDEEKATPEVMGTKLLEAVDYLPQDEHMVICRYYGLIGPKYKPESFSVIAKSHKTTSRKISALRSKGIKRLGKLCYKSLYHMCYKDMANEKLLNPKKYVELEFLYKGFNGTAAYSLFTRAGINYISELAEQEPDTLDEKISKMGYDLRFCDLINLIQRARNFVYTERMLGSVIIEAQNGLVYQTVADLEEFLLEDSMETLQKGGCVSINVFLNLSKLEIEFLTNGHLLQIDEIIKARKALGFPVTA